MPSLVQGSLPALTPRIYRRRLIQIISELMKGEPLWRYTN
jgi:hypothetical protein